MRTRRPKKQIRVPVTSDADSDGISMRAAFFILAVLIAGGLFYAYTTRPDLFAQLGKMNPLIAPHL